jgi:hypothetical protein
MKKICFRILPLFIAIITVLSLSGCAVAALFAPQVVKYNEKSEFSKDLSSLDAVYTAVRAEMMNEWLSECNTGTIKKGYDTKVLGKSLSALNDDDASDLEKALYAKLFLGNNPVLNEKFASDDVFKSNACDDGEIYIFIHEDGYVAVAAVAYGEICSYEGSYAFVSSWLTIDDVAVSRW